MAELLFDHLLNPQYATFDKSNYATQEQALDALEKSSTIYVGNLDPQTSEMQIRDFFSVIGPVVNVIKGINDLNKEPLKFCFVEFLHREHALAAVKTLTNTRCFGEVIRCSLDSGYLPGRELGRAANGYARGQWVDKGAGRGGGRQGGGGGRFNNNYRDKSPHHRNNNYTNNSNRERAPRPGDRGDIIPDGLVPPERLAALGLGDEAAGKKRDRSDSSQGRAGVELTITTVTDDA